MQPGIVSPQAARPPLRSIAWSIVLNAVVPVVLYELSKRYYSPSEVTALVASALFPLGKSGFDLILHRQLDPISVVVLLSIATDGVALAFGGSTRLLLVRESTFPGASVLPVSPRFYCLAR